MTTSNERPAVSRARRTLAVLEANVIPIFFFAICSVGVYYSGISWSYIANDLVGRLARDLVLVLALVVPVVAGLGLNFAVVLGAMAGQVGLIVVVNHGVHGLRGLLIAAAVALPIALIAGIVTGRLFNKARGREMITGIVLGFVANGIYQFIFLFLAGTSLIPMGNAEMIRPRPFPMEPAGLRNTVDLDPVKSALDNIFKITAAPAAPGPDVSGTAAPNAFEVTAQFSWAKFDLGRMNSGESSVYLEIPVVTFLVVAVLCGLILLLFRTKLGQDFRSIGQDQHVAEVAGINVNRTRVIAICISIVLAAIGQIMFLQEIGTMNTYNSHEQVGMYAVAALVIGGGTVSRAGIRHVLLGTLLFHVLLLVSPRALFNIIGRGDIAEYFRAFVVYGIVAVSLVVHAWQGRRRAKAASPP
ncbi:MAG: ABC transporter permease [Planctomycetota bacterium]|nr:ABC transporter permease [Planctomycetota bacterium]